MRSSDKQGKLKGTCIFCGKSHKKRNGKEESRLKIEVPNSYDILSQRAKYSKYGRTKSLIRSGVDLIAKEAEFHTPFHSQFPMETDNQDKPTEVDYHRTTNTTQTHRPSSKSERNLIILQVNINGLRNKLEELKLLIHDTHADIITIQETKLTPKAKTPKIHNFTSVRTDRLHKAGGGLITLIRDNITFTTTDIPSTINTHNIELQMVKVHINNTKHITIANIYIPPRDTTSTHYKTADTDIQHCIQYITNIPHSFLTGDVNAHSTLWHSYTDDHRG